MVTQCGAVWCVRVENLERADSQDVAVGGGLTGHARKYFELALTTGIVQTVYCICVEADTRVTMIVARSLIMIRIIPIMWIFAAVGFARADAVIFDNGPLSGPQVGRNMGTPFTIYENFALGGFHKVTGVRWTEHDASALTREYLGTVVSFYQSEPLNDHLLFSGTFMATRTLTGAVLQSEPLMEYEITGLSVDLEPGTYLLGLHDPHTGFSGWVQTTGSVQTIAGRWQSRVANSLGTFYGEEDSVFQLLGSPLPEPATFVVALQVALLALGSRRLRKTDRRK